MSGHVFVTRGDLTKLHCDAWLLPTSATLSVTHGFREQLPAVLQERLARLRGGEIPLPDGWKDDGVRVLSLADEPATQSRPWLVNVGGYGGRSVDWYMEGARQFFAGVAAHYSLEHQRVTERSKPLVGLPLIGTGKGGAGHIAGHILRALFTTLYTAAQAHDLDIVLVLAGGPAHVAAQNARWQISGAGASGEGADPWAELSERLLEKAQHLANAAVRGRLALFLGAGVSRGAGLPDWRQLLAALAEDAALDDRECQALATFDAVDQASLIEHRLAARKISLGSAISDRLGGDRYSLAHSLLAGLPVSDTVTTNYDCLFEAASVAAGRPAAVLPYQSVADHRRWLLKMHGCVSHPEDIVLTRAHFLRYRDTQAALAGIVQALLITRHLLFVGFSLSDHNFHQIVDDVRKARRKLEHQVTTTSPSGTALLLGRDDILRELWQPDLDLVSLSNEQHSSASSDARLLEIFLDYVLAEATRGAAPLLDPAYDGVLTGDERGIRQLLRNLQAQATDEIRRSPAWRPIAELLASLGGSPVALPTEEYRHRFLEQVNLDYATLREDAAAWKAEVAERQILDGTLLDGLDPNEVWTDDGSVVRADQLPPAS